MKTTKKILSIVLPVLAIAVFMFATIASFIYADSPIGTGWPETGDAKIETVVNLANRTWGTIIVIVQILAFSAIVFAGVRYMFASADQKQILKKV